MPDYEIFGLGDLALQRGMTLPAAKLAYKTYGSLAADRSNAVLCPTPFGAHHTDAEWAIGPGRILDTDRWFIVIINTEAGVRAMGRNSLRAAEMMGASRFQTFLYVVVPSAVPYVITGMRIAMGRSFTTIVAAEMLGASSGLGFMIFSAREFMRMDTILVGVVILGILGLTADYVFRLFAKYIGEEYVGRVIA